MNIVDLVILIIVANASPILATYAMRDALAYPLDAGRILFDGQRVFGESKTIRGIVAAIGLTTGAAIVMGHPAICGFLVGTYAMLGDLSSSFLKRRMQLPSSSRAVVLDQLPEVLLPTIILGPLFSLTVADVAVVVASFVVIALTVSPVLFKLGIRKERY